MSNRKKPGYHVPQSLAGMEEYEFGVMRWGDEDTDCADEDEFDEWFPYGCHDKDCIMPGSHYASECATAEQMDEYYEVSQ